MHFPEIFLNLPHVFPSTCVPQIPLAYKPKNVACRDLLQGGLGDGGQRLSLLPVLRF